MELTCAVSLRHNVVTIYQDATRLQLWPFMLQSSTNLRRGEEKKGVKRIVNQVTITGDHTSSVELSGDVSKDISTYKEGFNACYL